MQRLPPVSHIGGRPSSHKANLIPQNKRQDTTVIVIPCLCSFTVPSSPFSEPPANKKRTRTLSHRELGSSTNCMVDGTGLEQQRSRPPSAAETLLPNTEKRCSPFRMPWLQQRQWPLRYAASGLRRGTAGTLRFPRKKNTVLQPAFQAGIIGARTKARRLLTCLVLNTTRPQG